MPSSRAAHATAWPWLPALAAITPAARSTSPSPGGCDLEHLGGEIAAAAELELSFGLEPGAVLLDLLPQRLDALAAHRFGEHDRRAPPFPRPEGEHLSHLVQHRLRHRVVQL